MRKTIVSLAVLLTVGLVFMGCPKGDDGTDDNGSGDGAKTFTVKFDVGTDGNPVKPADQKVKENEFAKPPAPAPWYEANELKHWYETDKDAAFDFANTKIVKDTTLKAEYETVNTFDVTFDKNGATVAEMPDSQTVNTGRTATKPAANPVSTDEPVKDFQHWSDADDDANGAYDFSTPVAATLKLYAIWAEATK